MRIEITVSKTPDKDKNKPKHLQERLHSRVSIEGDKELVEEVHSMLEDNKMPDWRLS